MLSSDRPRFFVHRSFARWLLGVCSLADLGLIGSLGSIRLLRDVSLNLGATAGGLVLDCRGERGQVARRTGSGVPRWNDDNLQG